MSTYAILHLGYEISRIFIAIRMFRRQRDSFGLCGCENLVSEKIESSQNNTQSKNESI
jgi:hypothetical protein